MRKIIFSGFLGSGLFLAGLAFAQQAAPAPIENRPLSPEEQTIARQMGFACTTTAVCAQEFNRNFEDNVARAKELGVYKKPEEIRLANTLLKDNAQALMDAAASGDPEAVLRATQKLLDDPALQQQLAKAGVVIKKEEIQAVQTFTAAAKKLGRADLVNLCSRGEADEDLCAALAEAAHRENKTAVRAVVGEERTRAIEGSSDMLQAVRLIESGQGPEPCRAPEYRSEEACGQLMMKTVFSNGDVTSFRNFARYFGMSPLEFDRMAAEMRERGKGFETTTVIHGINVGGREVVGSAAAEACNRAFSSGDLATAGACRDAALAKARSEEEKRNIADGFRMFAETTRGGKNFESCRQNPEGCRDFIPGGELAVMRQLEAIFAKSMTAGDAIDPAVHLKTMQEALALPGLPPYMREELQRNLTQSQQALAFRGKFEKEFQRKGGFFLSAPDGRQYEFNSMEEMEAFMRDPKNAVIFGRQLLDESARRGIISKEEADRRTTEIAIRKAEADRYTPIYPPYPVESREEMIRKCVAYGKSPAECEKLIGTLPPHTVICDEHPNAQECAQYSQYGCIWRSEINACKYKDIPDFDPRCPVFSYAPPPSCPAGTYANQKPSSFISNGVSCPTTKWECTTTQPKDYSRFDVIAGVTTEAQCRAYGAIWGPLPDSDGRTPVCYRGPICPAVMPRICQPGEIPTGGICGPSCIPGDPIPGGGLTVNPTTITIGGHISLNAPGMNGQYLLQLQPGGIFPISFAAGIASFVVPSQKGGDPCDFGFNGAPVCLRPYLPQPMPPGTHSVSILNSQGETVAKGASVTINFGPPPGVPDCGRAITQNDCSAKGSACYWSNNYCTPTGSVIPPTGQREQIWNAYGLRSWIRTDALQTVIDARTAACKYAPAGADVWMPDADKYASTYFGMPDLPKCAAHTTPPITTGSRCDTDNTLDASESACNAAGLGCIWNIPATGTGSPFCASTRIVTQTTCDDPALDLSSATCTPKGCQWYGSYCGPYGTQGGACPSGWTWKQHTPYMGSCVKDGTSGTWTINSACSAFAYDQNGWPSSCTSTGTGNDCYPYTTQSACTAASGCAWSGTSCYYSGGTTGGGVNCSSAAVKNAFGGDTGPHSMDSASNRCHNTAMTQWAEVSPATGAVTRGPINCSTEWVNGCTGGTTTTAGCGQYDSNETVCRTTSGCEWRIPSGQTRYYCMSASTGTTTSNWTNYAWNSVVSSYIDPSVTQAEKDAGRVIVNDCQARAGRNLTQADLDWNSRGVPTGCRGTTPTTCPSGQSWNGTACVSSTTGICPAGQYWYVPPGGGAGYCQSTTTTTCPSGQWWDSATNTCKSSTTQTCPAGQYWYVPPGGGAGYCQSTTTTDCPSGQYWYVPPAGGPGYCQSSTTTTCPSGQWWDSTTNTCKSSTTTTNCGTGYWWDSTTNTCKSSCPSGQWWDSAAGKCQPSCGAPPSCSASEIATCDTSTAYVWVCKAGSTTTTTTCPDYQYLSGGICVNRCSSDQYWDSATQTCKTSSTTTSSGGCSAGTTQATCSTYPGCAWDATGNYCKSSTASRNFGSFLGNIVEVFLRLWL